MDTLRTAAKLNVSDQTADIKRYMPETYKSIVSKAAEIGNTAFELVRRGLRGEVNCFYAVEAGRVVGAPFDAGKVDPVIAVAMVQFGFKHVCFWGLTDAVIGGTDAH